MNSTTLYRRMLSPYERMWITAHNKSMDFIVEGDGELKQEKVQEAVARVGAANPGCRLVLKGCLSASYWAATGSLPQVRVVDGSHWSGYGPEGAPFIGTQLDPIRGPTVEVSLAPGSPARMVVRAHHAVMDGRAIISFTRNIFSVLRGLQPDAENASLTDLELARRLGGRTRKVKEACLNPFNTESTRERGSTWCRVTVPAKVFNLLPRTMLAIGRAARSKGDGDVLIDTPVDLRQYAPEVNSPGNLTGSLRLEIAPDATTRSITAELSRLIKDKRGADALIESSYYRHIPFWVMRLILNRLNRRALQNGAFTPTAVLTTLGMMDPADFSSPGFTCRSVFPIPPGVEMCPLFISMAPMGAHVELGAIAPSSLGSGGRLKAFVERLAAELAGPQ